MTQPTPAQRRDVVLNYYRTMLKSLSASEDSSGAIWIRLSENSEPIPFAHEGKQFYLPTEAVRSRQQTDRQFAQSSILFNPLTEYPTASGEGKETATRYAIRKTVNVTINTAIRGLLTGLLTILASPALHKGLEGDQRGLLSLYAKSDTTYEYVSSLIEAIKVGDPERRAVHIAYSNRVRIDDQEYLHAGVVSFPIVTQALQAREALKANQSAKIMGVTAKSHAQIDLLLALMDYLLPGCSDGQPWKQYSVSPVAPRILAVYKAIYALAEPLMQIQKRFDQAFSEKTLFQHDSAWMEEINGMAAAQELSIALKLLGDGDATQVSAGEAPAAKPNRRRDAIGDATQALSSSPAPAQPSLAPNQPQRPTIRPPVAAQPARGGSISLQDIQQMQLREARAAQGYGPQSLNPVASAIANPGSRPMRMGGTSGGVGIGQQLRNMDF